MTRRTDNQQDVAPRVIISVNGGVPDTVFKPAGVSVTIYDYDVEGAECCSRDPDGRACSIGEWPWFERVTENRHWPIVRRALCRAKYPYSRKWKCPDCGKVVDCSYEDLAQAGSPHCVDCDIEMRMV